MADDDYNAQTIYVGPPDGNENEHTKVGESSTMFPQAYEFQWGDKKVRFIDTPGIGDSRGLPQDKINLANIFRYIEEYPIKHLSAVIILMKPNQKVFTTAFTYCINELFTHLPKSCAKNVLFGFTGTRPFCYRIVETFAPLRQFLSTIKERQGVILKVNEAFRFLVASLPENGITFTADDRKNNAASWDQSAKETQRFLNRVSTLTPHDTTDIIDINKARQYMIGKPISSISDMIQLNIESIDAEMKRIKCLDTKYATDYANFERDLNKKHKKVYYLSENLSHPRVVCTSRDCTEMVTDEYGTSQVQYTQHCHDPCNLKITNPKCVGDPEFQNCTAMGGTPNCKECGCHWSVHMYVKYKLTMHSEMIETVNEDIKRLLIETGNKRKELQMAVDNLLITLKEYKDEKDVIENIRAMFGSFLKKNAIMPFNDAVEKYIELSIQQAENCAKMKQKSADFELVVTLQEWLMRYKQQKHYIETGEANGCTASEVKEYCKQLLNSKHSGRYIKEMFEKCMEDQKKHMQSGAQSAGNQPSASHGSESQWFTPLMTSTPLKK